jgi:hypothetical protein
LMRLKKKEFLSLQQGECQWQSTGTGSSSCLVMHQRRWQMTQRSRSASWRDWLDRFGTSWRLTLFHLSSTC